MIPRHSAKFMTIGVAAVLALGVTTPAVAQVPTDTAAAGRSDTTPAVSQQRIPVTKEQGGFDTTTSSGALSRQFDTTTSGMNRDTTTGAVTDTTTGAVGDTTTGVVTDTSTGAVTDTTTGAPIDTTTRQGITGINDTTVTGDTTMRDTLTTDTSTTMTDTTMMRDTTMMQDTTMQRDTTMMPSDTTTMPTDTTTMPRDTTMMPGDTSAMPSDTTTAGAVTPSPTSADTVGMYPSGPGTGRFGRGFYIGVGGGASVPMGDLHDGGYDTGWNVTVPIGWQSSTTPWGLRVDASYDRLNGGTASLPGGSVSLSDAKIWSGTLDITLQFPFGNNRSAFYLLGGGGIHHFSDYGNGQASVGGTPLYGNSNSSTTRAGINGGLGLSFGWARANVFLESRYISVFTKGNNSNYVPIILGVRFYGY